MLRKFNVGVVSLLVGVDKPELPLNSLFQIDLLADSEVKRRTAELETNASVGQVLATAEFAEYLKCAKSREANVAIEQLAALQAKLNADKAKFLQLPKAQRKLLLLSYESRLKQSGISNSAAEPSAAEKPDGAILIAEYSVLEQRKIELETSQVNFLKILKSKDIELSRLRDELAELSKENSPLNSEQLSTRYSKAVEIWRQTSESLFNLYNAMDPTIAVELPEPIVMRPTLSSDQEGYSEYLQAFEQVNTHRHALSDTRIKLANNLKSQNFVLLSDAGSLRADLLKKCDLVDCDRVRGLSGENLMDFQLELKLVPLKFASGALSKSLEVKSKFKSGIDGWIDLTKQLVFLIGLMLIPFAFIRSLRWMSRQIDEARKTLLAKSMMDYRRRTMIATWISRLNPFLTPVGMIVALYVARGLISQTDFAELARILYYAGVFYTYRVSRLLLAIFLEVLFSTNSVERIKDQKLKIHRSAGQISRLVFIEYVLLQVTEDAARRAFVYQILSSATFWFNIAFALYEANLWRVEILAAFELRFLVLSKRFLPALNSKFGIVLLPLVFAVVAANDIFATISRYLIRIDFVKRLLSDILRKRLEHVDDKAVGVGEPPQSYLEEFDYYRPASDQIIVLRENTGQEKLASLISDWFAGRVSDDLAVLVGNRGMGRSTTLAQVFRSFEKAQKVHSAAIVGRILEPARLFEWLSKAFGIPVASLEDIVRVDQQMREKHLMLVDDIQNLFLGNIGGFEAYRIFMEVVSLKTKNIFWCLTINSRSWFYIRGVFGQEHFYGKQFLLSPWSDVEIQSLILKRHQKSGLRRDFDESIKAYGAGDALGQQAEAQFFRLLWGQSRGNPRSALMYWVSALSANADGSIHVGIPSFINSSLVASMSDDSLFLLAAIARFENVTHDELRSVTNIRDLVIRKCLKEASDKGLIWSDDVGRIRISSRAQYVVDYFLTGKNFLYE